MYNIFMNERFFINEEPGPFVVLKDKQTLKHMKVLRLKEKDKITLLDGRCGKFEGIIEKIDKTSCSVRITKREKLELPLIDITLVQGLCKHPKMDIVIRGVSNFSIKRIIPIITKRSQQKGENIERLRNIAESSFLTRGGGLLPEIYDCLSLHEAIEIIKGDDLILVPYEEERERHFKDVLTLNKSLKAISIFIGPEGGFEKDEVGEVQKIGGIPVSLGETIIKTEYAGFFAISCILYEFTKTLNSNMIGRFRF